MFFTHTLSLPLCLFLAKSKLYAIFSFHLSLSFSHSLATYHRDRVFLLFHTSISMVSRARIKKVVRNVFFPPRDRFSSLFKLGGLSAKEAKNLILETHLRYKKIFLQKLCQNINEFHQTYTVVLQN